jgi:hypothetical protein
MREPLRIRIGNADEPVLILTGPGGPVDLRREYVDVQSYEVSQRALAEIARRLPRECRQPLSTETVLAITAAQTSPAPIDDALAGVGTRSGTGGDQPSSESPVAPTGGTVAFTDGTDSGVDQPPAEDTPAGAPPVDAGDGSTPPGDGASVGGDGPAGVIANDLAQAAASLDTNGTFESRAGEILRALNGAGYLILTNDEVDAIVADDGGEV